MRHRSGTVAMAAMVALAMSLGACTTSPSAPSDTPSASAEPTEPVRSTSPTAAGSEAVEAERVEVLMADSSFDPAVLTIAAGTEVVFVNGDTYGHTITEGSGGVAVDDPFVDEDLEAEPVGVVFDVPGTYELTCRIHPTMNMTITVEA